MVLVTTSTSSYTLAVGIRDVILAVLVGQLGVRLFWRWPYGGGDQQQQQWQWGWAGGASRLGGGGPAGGGGGGAAWCAVAAGLSVGAVCRRLYFSVCG